MIRDLGSLNGTYVGGQRVREAPLPPNKEFTVGPLTFRVRYEYSGDLGKLPPIVLAGETATAYAAQPAEAAPDANGKALPAAPPVPVEPPVLEIENETTPEDELGFELAEPSAAAADELMFEVDEEPVAEKAAVEASESPASSPADEMMFEVDEEPVAEDDGGFEVDEDPISMDELMFEEENEPHPDNASKETPPAEDPSDADGPSLDDFLEDLK